MNSAIKIISGGQTGVDRAALDWAIRNNISYGGWCPKGRRAEDGVIPQRYELQETQSMGYMQRTKWNVRDSDSTLIITQNSNLTGGSKFTHEYAIRIAKPCLHLYTDSNWREHIKVFLEMNSIKILNIAGPRASSAPEIEKYVNEVLDEVWRSCFC